MSFQAWWEAENITDTTFLDKENCWHLWEAAQAELRAVMKCGHSKAYRVPAGTSISEPAYCAMCELDKVKAERDAFRNGSLEADLFKRRLATSEELRSGLANCLAQATERITALEMALAETAIPLEVLNLHMRATSISLCDELKQGITKAVESLRKALLAPTVPPAEKEKP